LREAGLAPSDLDAIGYSYEPRLAPPSHDDITASGWEDLRTLYVRRAPLFLKSALPGLDPAKVEFVPHHVAHAASAYLAAPWPISSVMVLDGRGERASSLIGRAIDGELKIFAIQELPHSLGLVYEELTDHLGFRRSSDEYKVMALASYGRPRFLGRFRELLRATDDGHFRTEPIDWHAFAPRVRGEHWDEVHADLASTVQQRLQEVMLSLAQWLHTETGDRHLTMAGGVALNCVASSWLLEQGPFEDIWIQPAAGDAGTALGAALYVAQRLGDVITPMETAALGRRWSDEDIGAWLARADVPHERPEDLADEVADILARNGVVAWFQGRSEYGPRALGHRSLLANPSHPDNLRRMNDIKGREHFRPIAPMVLLERASELFEGGPIPSPYMLFTHRVKPAWRPRIPAVVHVDGTARIQTIDQRDEPLVARMLEAFERRTGIPVVVNTSLNTAGRPMVDDPRDALECFGSGPIDALAIGPYLVRRAAWRQQSMPGGAP
jgi:carbamoyltransferase